MDIPFDCDSHRVDGRNLSFLDSGSSKPPLHLYHANGFPISVYLPLMSELAKNFRVVGMGLRGQDAQTEGNTSWARVADDLIDFLEVKQLGPVLGVGHSVGGAATMIAAAKRPDLFSKIILIDPVLMSLSQIAVLADLRLKEQKDRFFLARKARQRRNGWSDRYQVYDYLKNKSLFKRFEDVYLRSYVTYGFVPSSGGRVELLCPPEAEARIFESYPLDIWKWPHRIKSPTLIIRGELSDVLSPEVVGQFCKACKHSQSLEIKQAGHLIPMERPGAIISAIKQFYLSDL